MFLIFLHGKIIFIGLENFKNFLKFLKSPKDKIRDDPPSEKILRKFIRKFNKLVRSIKTIKIK